MAEELFKQLTPETWDELADWCGGVKTIIDGNQAVMIIVDGTVTGTAHLGDWVCQETGGVFEVWEAEDFTHLVNDSGETYTGYEATVDDGA